MEVCNGGGVLLRVSARITKLAQFVRFEGQLMGLNVFLTS